MQERERQGDLVRDLVLSRIQRSPDKVLSRERRGSYGSLSPPYSARNSRCESEPRTVEPERKDIFTLSHSVLRPVAEAKSTEFLPGSPAKGNSFSFDF